MPPKPDLVFHNALNDVETVHPTFNVELSLIKPDNDLSHTHRPSIPITEDWVSNSEDESETKLSQRLSSFVQPNEQVKSPRPSIQHVKTSIPTTNPETAIPKPTSNGTRRKPESKVNVSPSSNAQSKKHDDKTKREAKGKSHVESLIGYRNLSAEFEDFSDNRINENNAAGTLVPTVGQI
nr:hypothetical protein [Tanacetum cinerariifolium]